MTSVGTDVVDGDFFGPLDYSAWFPWVGLGLLVLVAAWYTYVLPSTRRRPAVRTAAQTAPSAPFAAPDLARLRRDYLQRIDAVDREAAAGTRSNRSAHQELSLLVRGFVRDASGVDAPRMTLAELRAVSPAARNLPAAADAVAAMYPGEFATAPASAVPDAAETARGVVRSWN